MFLTILLAHPFLVNRVKPWIQEKYRTPIPCPGGFSEMKRFLALLLTAVLLCACALPAAGEGSWVSVLQAAADLMTATSNVTLHVRADLTYNRQRFKNVNLSYVQDGKNSLLDLRLRSLRTDDTVYESGYTVHCMDGVLHVVPDLRDPSRVEVREGFTNADTILRLTPSQESYLNTALRDGLPALPAGRLHRPAGLPDAEPGPRGGGALPGLYGHPGGGRRQHGVHAL